MMEAGRGSFACRPSVRIVRDVPFIQSPDRKGGVFCYPMPIRAESRKPRVNPARAGPRKSYDGCSSAEKLQMKNNSTSTMAITQPTAPAFEAWGFFFPVAGFHLATFPTPGARKAAGRPPKKTRRRSAGCARLGP